MVPYQQQPLVQQQQPLYNPYPNTMQYYGQPYQQIPGMPQTAMGGYGAANGMNMMAGPIIPPKPHTPKVSYVWWEDQNVQCYVWEYNGVLVLRRSDNDMINGTKMLNTKGITRGRRTGMLKNEKIRHVIKYGSMPFIGIWIPLERAKMYAKREGTYEGLKPIFDENIKDHVEKKLGDKDL
ncbi:unnamed protein product [Ambrosiozyma monospora]|nr:unnamed protein product [Ambrosiozyma monospora]